MPNEELIEELNGKVAIYKEEIRRLNQAIIRKNHSSDKLRYKVEVAEAKLKDLGYSRNGEGYEQDEDSWTDSWEDEEMKALSPEEALWIDGVSENPDAGKV